MNIYTIEKFPSSTDSLNCYRNLLKFLLTSTNKLNPQTVLCTELNIQIV